MMPDQAAGFFARYGSNGTDGTTLMLHPPGPPYKLPGETLPEDQTLVYPPEEELSWVARLKAKFDGKAWLAPFLVFVAAAVVLSLFSWDHLLKPSPDTHFVYLANTYNSMLAAPFNEAAAERREGKAPFELDRDPHHRNDWASYHELTLRDGETFKGVWMDQAGSGRFRLLGTNEAVHLERRNINHRQSQRRYFVSFPPGPSFLMMPLAAIWGYDINDVIFTLFFGALNVMLMFLVLRRLSVGGRSGRSRADNLWLTGLFGFGTVHLWLAVMGQVWFTALVVGATFTLLYMLFAIDAKRPLLAGICLALAFATRTPLVFTAIFFFAFVFFPGGRLLTREKYGEAAKKLALFCIPCLIMGLGLLWMNYLRFESFTEFGHRYLAAGQINRIQQYGLFNSHFLSKNLTAMFTLMPRFQGAYPYVTVSTHGMSLLLTTPAFVYLLMQLKRVHRPDKFLWALLWITVAACAIPGLFYQNTGWEQAGFRFSLDFTPYLIAILAIGRRPLTWVFKLCVIAGFVVNGFAAITFKRFTEFYGNFFV
ncbi:MAG: hypothetical protein ACNA8W_00110 [Bradymonadaceae bacterium]